MTTITRNLPSFIKDPLIGLIGTKCYISLVENLHVADVVCLKLAISKGLGIAIVLGGAIMKVPQLMLILKARHARGLSLPAFALETLAYLITLFYAYRNKYPFSTYGENLFLTIQNTLITLLIIYYFPTSQSHLTTKRARSNRPIVGLAAAIAVVTSYTLLVIPMSSLQLLQLGTVPISLFSKIPQISENYRNKSTGQLSVFAVASQVFGCAARLFTTATEMGDSLVFAGFALAFVLNVILGLQIWVYWGQTVPGPTSTKEQWPKEKIGLTTTHSPDAFAPSVNVQPSFVHMNAPVQPTGGRRWARKVD
ncbi:mannose-P-dolichol utilization defect 1 protein [Serendipita vermifera]|nr:mannose-P-dolichol utilization defect 1 protein [Serendipita vermifera]